MAVSSAKVLRPQVRNAIREAFVERGWEPHRGQAIDFDAPVTMVVPPLRFEWRVEAEGAKYGGVRLSGSGAIRHDRVAAIVAALPDEALPRVKGSVRERADYFSLDRVSTYGLARGLGWTAPPGDLGTWTVDSVEGVGPVVETYFELIDGPLGDWIQQRRDVDAVLDDVVAAEPISSSVRSSTSVRALGVLALISERPVTARRAAAGFRPRTDLELVQLRRFEQELIAQFPQYGEPLLD